MTALTQYPLAVLVVTFVVLWFSAWIGTVAFKGLRSRMTLVQEDFTVVQGATLTLLGLIIGFTFSMALTRYDQRKNYEEEEANAIGTEFVRADLLPAAERAKVRSLLQAYVEQRLLFYTTRDRGELERIDATTAKLQGELWSAVRAAAEATPTPITALAVSGMNDVLNTQGYTQAAWRNRIPVAAWLLMGAIAVCSTLLVGIGLRNPDAGRGFIVIMPLVVSIAFFLIADIDSPRQGVIRVSPQNLESLAQQLRAP